MKTVTFKKMGGTSYEPQELDPWLTDHSGTYVPLADVDALHSELDKYRGIDAEWKLKGCSECEKLRADLDKAVGLLRLVMLGADEFWESAEGGPIMQNARAFLARREVTPSIDTVPLAYHNEQMEILQQRLEETTRALDREVAWRRQADERVAAAKAGEKDIGDGEVRVARQAEKRIAVLEAALRGLADEAEKVLLLLPDKFINTNKLESEIKQADEALACKEAL